MSTNDVPGASAANRDELRAGCWAEHKDGSLIFVKGTEGGRVVYEIYDLSTDPPTRYQDAMLEAGFKNQFSYPPVGSSPDLWTWHDKTPFPWNRVMGKYKPGVDYASVQDQMTAAARVAESLKLRAEEVKRGEYGHMTPETASLGRAIIDKITEALKSAFPN